MTVKWFLLLFFLIVFIEIDNTKYVLIETEDSSKLSLFTLSMNFIIDVFSSRDFRVDYKGDHFQRGESCSIDGCNSCSCGGYGLEGSPECEACTE